MVHADSYPSTNAYIWFNAGAHNIVQGQRFERVERGNRGNRSGGVIEVNVVVIMGSKKAINTNLSQYFMDNEHFWYWITGIILFYWKKNSRFWSIGQPGFCMWPQNQILSPAQLTHQHRIRINAPKTVMTNQWLTWGILSHLFPTI